MPKRPYTSGVGAAASDRRDEARRRRLNADSSSSGPSQSQYVPQSTGTNGLSSSSQTSSGRRQLPWQTPPGTQGAQSRPNIQGVTTSTHTARSSQATPSSQRRPPEHVQAIHDTLNWLSTQPDILESDDEAEVIDLTQADPGPVLEFYGHFGSYTIPPTAAYFRR